MADIGRLDVFYVHPSKGKKLVTGMDTKETLGYIAHGSYIQNVAASDVAATPGVFICAVCQKPFTIRGKMAYCLQDFPPQQQPRPVLGDLRARTAQERVTAMEARQGQLQQQQRHSNFQGQPVDPWGDQAQANPNQGYAQQRTAAQPQAPQAAPIPQTPVFNPPPPPQPEPPQPSGALDDPKQVVAAQRRTKEQAFGIPVMQPDQVGPPPNLAQPPVTEPAPVAIPPAGVKETLISDIEWGRSVNAHHRQLLVDNQIITLQDALDKGKKGLKAISGIGDSVANAVIGEAETQIALT